MGKRYPLGHLQTWLQDKPFPIAHLGNFVSDVRYWAWRLFTREGRLDG